MDVGYRYNSFREEVQVFCRDQGLSEPLIIAVSKTQAIETIEDAVRAGIRDLGENYARDLIAKSSSFPQARWHFIGHLQRRHVKQLVPHMYMLHTLDSERLVDHLAKYNYNNDVLIQVNISGEKTKSGIEFLDSKIHQLSEYADKKDVKITGLMAIGSFTWDAKTCENKFRELVKMGENMGYNQFSMGMSNDWQCALQAGATIIRIGTNIFGKR